MTPTSGRWCGSIARASPKRFRQNRGVQLPETSPDGKKIAVSTVYPTADVLVYDIPRAAFTRLTFDGNNVRSVWTPDGTRVTFSSDRAGGLPNIYWVASDGSGSPERLTTSDFEQYPEDWAPDGKTLVFGEMRPETNWDIWTLPFPDRTPQLFMRTRFFEGARSVSPDGRWLSYHSDNPDAARCMSARF